MQRSNSLVLVEDRAEEKEKLNIKIPGPRGSGLQD